MKNLQKIGGLAALYLAAAYLLGIVLFLFVLDYPSIVEPAQKVALLVDKQATIYITNLVMYVIFGFFLVVLSLALYERLKTSTEQALLRTATVIGLIWSGALIASGMVANAGIAPIIELYATDPAQAALIWLGIESVANGLGGANGEILGGLWVFLLSWTALKTGGLPKPLNYLGLVVGAVGIFSLIPGLHDLSGLFGMSQIVWFVWLGIIMLRKSSSAAA
ncbi:MAG: DUF4386 family protein [Anaerolineales bacterium]|nr:DUF4386 family protein [Chloroflexota bacterium]MBL6982647.1 DUF4386 family protein [Anaerolineales bacterium]